MFTAIWRFDSRQTAEVVGARGSDRSQRGGAGYKGGAYRHVRQHTAKREAVFGYAVYIYMQGSSRSLLC